MRKIGLIAALVACVTVSMDAMTKAQMQTLATAITNAGYETRLIPAIDGTWTVRARSGAVDVTASAANNLATSQGLPAFVALVEFGPMNLTKMQAVTTAITNAGYSAAASQVSAGVWTVRATSTGLDIPTADAVALATAQAVPAFVAEVEYR